ncbi:radical SAM protein [Desulfovibrio sp. OttesenSCG-928-A18]|nr:radical SAM protein [Desulfovibrio sp. OttesenSCG-928-A18]
MDEGALPDGFDYVGDVYRPPYEAQAILMQATVGCSYGKCTFCSGHADKAFAIKDQAILERDIAFAGRYCTRQDRVFIMDGNALCMPMPRWRWLLGAIRRGLPWVAGLATFATARDVAEKSDADLHQLRELGLDRIYMGVESGNAETLKRLRKGIDPAGLLLQGRRVGDAGMELVCSVMLGIVNAKDSLRHARETGQLLSGMRPDIVTVLTLIAFAGTGIKQELERGDLNFLSVPQVLEELQELLLHTELAGGLFDCSHSSGYVHFKARLPEEKQSAQALIDQALAGKCPLTPDAARRI